MLNRCKVVITITDLKTIKANVIQHLFSLTANFSLVFLIKNSYAMFSNLEGLFSIISFIS